MIFCRYAPHLPAEDISKINVAKVTRFFYEKFIEPRSKDEDSKRRESIVNILLMAVVFLFGVGFFVALYQEVLQGRNPAFSPSSFFIILLIFLALTLISRVGYFIFSAYVLISMLFF